MKLRPAPGALQLQARPPSQRERRAQQIATFLAEEPGWKEVRAGVLAGPALLPSPRGNHHVFELEMAVPVSFPDDGVVPEVRIVRHDLTIELGLDTHVVTNNTLCLQVPGSGDIDVRSGGLDAVKKQVAIHLARIVHVEHYGLPFPGEAFSHGTKGLVEYLATRLPAPLKRYLDLETELPGEWAHCPCGSAERFRECHRDSLRAKRAWLRQRERRFKRRLPRPSTRKP